MATATHEKVLVTRAEDDPRRKQRPHSSSIADDAAYRASLRARFKAHAALAEAHGLPPDLIPYACAPAKAGVIVAVHDEPDGPWTTLRSAVGQKVIEGEALGLATAGPHLVVLRTDFGVAFVDLTREALLASFAIDAWRCLPMVADHDVAIVHYGESLVIVFAGGNITRLPFPHPPPPYLPGPYDPGGVVDEYIELLALSADDAASRAPLAITPSSFVVTAGGQRITIARSSVAVGPPGLITLDALSIAPREGARSDGEKCIWLDPARLPPLEPFPTMPSYADLGISPSERIARMFAELPMLWDLWGPNISIDYDPELDDARPGIASFTDAIGLRPSSLLLRFVHRQVTDRFLQDALYKIVGYLRPDLRPLDPGCLVDPCLFILFDHNDRCYHAFYDYPPTRAAGHAVVFYDRLNHSVEWIAPSFDSFLAAKLAEAFPATHALRLLRMLGLPPEFIDVHPASAPPPWFEAAHARQALPYRASSKYYDPLFEEDLRRGDKARERGDLITAERAYVRALHAGPDRQFDKDHPARAIIAARLADTYAALGWPFHERRMREV